MPTADRQKATVKVRIGFEQLDPRILPDMGVKVAFLAKRRSRPRRGAAQPATLVPKAAVRTATASTTSSSWCTDDTVERRAVSVGGADGDRVEVLAGRQRRRARGGRRARGR